MINAEYYWTVILALGLGTLCIRGSIIFLSHRIQIGTRVREIFSFIPAAILPSMIAPMVFFHKGQVEWLMGKERFFVLVLATLVCYFARNMLLTISFGLGTLYILTQIF